MDEGVRDEHLVPEEDANEDLELEAEDAEQVSGGANAWPRKVSGGADADGWDWRK
jgi:hypothetical protein